MSRCYNNYPHSKKPCHLSKPKPSKITWEERATSSILYSLSKSSAHP